METQPPNRAPGIIKPLWKWGTRMHPRYNISDKDQTELKNVLAEINSYMKVNNARYAFILTDFELVVVRRVNGDGDLELADPMP